MNLEILLLFGRKYPPLLVYLLKYTYMEITKILRLQTKKAIKDLYQLDFNDFLIEHPQNDNFGDFAVNVGMILAKVLHKSPMVIAEEISSNLNNQNDTNMQNNVKLFSKVYAIAPGFINFVLSPDWLVSQLHNITVEYSGEKIGEKILIEYSQPNPNKPQHIGHARNNFLGSSLATILQYLGADVVKANYFNDWSTAICKSMLMYDKYFKNQEPNKKSDHFIGDMYIRYTQEEEKNPDLKNEVQEMFVKLENGDPYVLSLWKKVTGWAYDGWKTTYENQNVSFDVIFTQSDYKDSGKEIVDIALNKGIAEKDETGAVVARLEKYGLPDKVLLRSDGTSIYITQDLQLAKDTFEKFSLDKRLYVVDNRQSDYFRQLFKIFEILGFDFANKIHHVSYGFVSLPEGQMSSRTGLVVNADDAFETVKKVEAEEIDKSIKNVTNKEDTINKISLAAFRYAILKIDPKKDVVFKYDQITKFDGNTGPYLLYTYARMNSVLEKSKLNPDELLLTKDILDNVLSSLDSKEIAILRHLYQFDEVVLNAGLTYSPHVIANYLFELCQRFNSFYSSLSILDADTNEKKKLRLLITIKTANVLKTGLGLLGINVVAKM